MRRLAKETPVTYMIFDLLWLDGHSLMELPYTERRARLAELELGDGGRWRVPDYVVGHGAQLLAATEQQGLEGVIAKRLDSPYEPGRRTPSWLKIKNTTRQEVVVGGWVPGEGKRRERIGALLVGVREDDGALRHVGRVGTGFTEAELDRLAEMLRPLEREDSPFAPGGPKIPRGAVFAEPELVAEVEFREWTDGGQLRAPSYKGLRDDKPAELVVREEANADRWPRSTARQVKLSNLDKVLYPEAGFAKRDVIDYYARIAPAVLPHLEGRALTLKRYPNGVDAPVLLREERAVAPPRLGSAPRAWASIDYVLADDEPTLVWLANLADLELHTSLALADDARAPDARRLRPRSRPAGDDRRVLPRRGAAARHVRGPGSRVLRQDVGLEGHAGLPPAQQRGDLRADQGLLQGRRRAAGARGARARRRAPDQVRARGQGARRLGPERRQQDDGQRLLAARDGAPDGVHAGHVGRGPRGAGARGPHLRGAPTSCAASTSTATSSRRC